MNIPANAASAVALCAMVSLAADVAAQVPVNAHPAKAPPSKPLVVTAVAPKGPIPGGKQSIIFVGGKAQSGGDAALNPQPIPPGHGGPGAPIR